MRTRDTTTKTSACGERDRCSRVVLADDAGGCVMVLSVARARLTSTTGCAPSAATIPPTMSSTGTAAAGAHTVSARRGSGEQGRGG